MIYVQYKTNVWQFAQAKWISTNDIAKMGFSLNESNKLEYNMQPEHAPQSRIKTQYISGVDRNLLNENAQQHRGLFILHLESWGSFSEDTD